MSKELAKAAAMAALRVRMRTGIAITDPANPVDIAQTLGLEVRFQRISSLEGMLMRVPHPVILLSSQRPRGRIAFTCAHELGHHCFGHPGHVDVEDEELLISDDNANEYQAHMFAAHLLMPKTTVQHGFRRRNIDPVQASPRDMLAVSQWLGVGYSTLIKHMSWNLGLLSRAHADSLLQHTPKSIVGDVPHLVDGRSVYLIDRAWTARPIDLEVGDVAFVEGRVALSGGCVELRDDLAGRQTIVAVRPGTGHVDGGAGWASSIRVQRHHYEGRAIFRHLEETDDER